MKRLFLYCLTNVWLWITVMITIPTVLAGRFYLNDGWAAFSKRPVILVSMYLPAGVRQPTRPPFIFYRNNGGTEALEVTFNPSAADAKVAVIFNGQRSIALHGQQRALALGQ